MSVTFDPGPPPASDFSVRLTEEQVESFHRDGFVHIERITTGEELEWLAPLYDHLFERKGAFKGGYFDLSRKYDSDGQDFVPQVLSPEYRFPQLAETTVRRNALGIASQLLQLPEADVKAWGHMIMKPPHVGGELPWHQDEAYWDVGFRYRAIGCWVPLDPATPQSGCMTFLPGSHQGPVRDHRHIDDDPEIHGLVVSDRDAVDDAQAVAVPLSPGGATFHHCRTLHRTPPNVSDHVRRAWATEFQVAPVPLAEGEHPDRPWMREFEEAWERRPIIQQVTGRST